MKGSSTKNISSFFFIWRMYFIVTNIRRLTENDIKIWVNKIKRHIFCWCHISGDWGRCRWRKGFIYPATSSLYAFSIASSEKILCFTIHNTLCQWYSILQGTIIVSRHYFSLKFLRRFLSSDVIVIDKTNDGGMSYKYIFWTPIVCTFVKML